MISRFGLGRAKGCGHWSNLGMVQLQPEMQLWSANHPLLFPLLNVDLKHFFPFCIFSSIYLCLPAPVCSHPPLPLGEVVTCPDGTWGNPPSCSCVEDNTAYFGNNARVGSSNPQPSRAACARSCREHPECQFWTWGKGSPMGPCYLKHSRDNVSPGLTSYVSGSKLCVLPESEGKPEGLRFLLGLMSSLLF